MAAVAVRAVGAVGGDLRSDSVCHNRHGSVLYAGVYCFKIGKRRLGLLRQCICRNVKVHGLFAEQYVTHTAAHGVRLIALIYNLVYFSIKVGSVSL